MDELLYGALRIRRRRYRQPKLATKGNSTHHATSCASSTVNQCPANDVSCDEEPCESLQHLIAQHDDALNNDPIPEHLHDDGKLGSHLRGGGHRKFNPSGPANGGKGAKERKKETRFLLSGIQSLLESTPSASAASRSASSGPGTGKTAASEPKNNGKQRAASLPQQPREPKPPSTN